MAASPKPGIRYLRAVVAFTPWVLSMFVLYWLEYGGVWTLDTPHRGKMSVAILGTGLLLSFLIQSYFIKRQKRQQ